MYGEGERYLHELDDEYKVYKVKRRWTEEWPSEKWNYQDNLSLENLKSMKVPNLTDKNTPNPDKNEDEESVQTKDVSKEELKEVLTSIDGIGNKKFDKIIEEVGSTQDVVGVLDQSPAILINIKGITKKLIDKITDSWENFRK